MSPNSQPAETKQRPRKTAIRWTLRIVAIVIGIVALIDLVITVIPEPPPPRPQIFPGGIVTWTSYSETDLSVVRAKNRVQSFLNPVGWVALVKGYGPDRLYILKRSQNWKDALETGQVLTVLALLVLPFPLWFVSLKIVWSK